MSNTNPSKSSTKVGKTIATNCKENIYVSSLGADAFDFFQKIVTKNIPDEFLDTLGSNEICNPLGLNSSQVEFIGNMDESTYKTLFDLTNKEEGSKKMSSEEKLFLVLRVFRQRFLSMEGLNADWARMLGVWAFQRDMNSNRATCLLKNTTLNLFLERFLEDEVGDNKGISKVTGCSTTDLGKWVRHQNSQGVEDGLAELVIMDESYIKDIMSRKTYKYLVKEMVSDPLLEVNKIYKKKFQFWGPMSATEEYTALEWFLGSYALEVKVVEYNKIKNKLKVHVKVTNKSHWESAVRYPGIIKNLIKPWTSGDYLFSNISHPPMPLPKDKNPFENVDKFPDAYEGSTLEQTSTDYHEEDGTRHPNDNKEYVGEEMKFPQEIFDKFEISKRILDKGAIPSKLVWLMKLADIDIEENITPTELDLKFKKLFEFFDKEHVNYGGDFWNRYEAKNVEIDLKEYQEIDESLKKTVIYFESGKSGLSIYAEKVLDCLVFKLKGISMKLNILIKGYTDPIGQEKDNQELSQDRVDVVSGYFYLLRKNMKIETDSKAYGEKNLVDTMDNTKNRRVEIHISKGE